MTLQDLDAAFRARVAKDKKLAEIRRKIAAGKATFRDTAAYSERISNLLGETLSGHIEQIPASERAKICEWLLRNQYADTACAAEAALPRETCEQGFRRAGRRYGIHGRDPAQGKRAGGERFQILPRRLHQAQRGIQKQGGTAMLHRSRSRFRLL